MAASIKTMAARLPIGEELFSLIEVGKIHTYQIFLYSCDLGSQ